MQHPNTFQEALTHDLNSIGQLKIRPLSAREVYFPYIKTMGLIYSILCVIAVVLLKMGVILGFQLTPDDLVSITKKSLVFNLIPLIFIMFGFSQGFILWSSIKSELHSAPYIKALIAFYIECYFIVYALLLFIAIVLLQFTLIPMILVGVTLLSLFLFMFFLNVESQRLGQGVLIKQLIKLFSQAKSRIDSEYSQ